MLEMFSWKDFVIAGGIACGLWYGYLLFTGKLKRTAKVANGMHPSGSPRGKPRRQWSLVEETTVEEADLPDEDLTDDEDDLALPDEARSLKALEGLADDLQQIIAERAGNPDKDGLLTRLEQEVARYPALNRPAFVAAISNLVIRAAKAECGITITRQEADELWLHF